MELAKRNVMKLKGSNKMSSTIKIVEDVILSDGMEHTILIVEVGSELYFVEVKGRFEAATIEYANVTKAYYNIKDYHEANNR